MEHEIKQLLEHTHGSELREFVTKHIKAINHNKDENEVILLVDKQYTINEIESSSHIEDLKASVEKAFGGSMVLRLETPHHGHDREMNVPHTIHR